MRFLFASLFLSLTFLTSGQYKSIAEKLLSGCDHATSCTKTITGKVLDNDFNTLYGVVIMNTDNLELGTTNLNGEFTIQASSTTNQLSISAIGMETASIVVPPACTHLEIIMIPRGTYHYRSSRKIDRARKDWYSKIPELHLQAFKKGLFKVSTPCYTSTFKPDKPELDKISKFLKAETKRVKSLFHKLQIGDTVQVPFSGTPGSDGTDRISLTPWAYFTDETKFQCFIEGIVTRKYKRDGGYNIDITVTDCNNCKYNKPIIYEGKEMVIGTVFRHNMRMLKVKIK